MLDPDSSFFSREIPLDTGDMVLMYTDGLAEVRYGDAQFGEDRIAMHLRRDPTVSPDVLCKSLLEAGPRLRRRHHQRRRGHPRRPPGLNFAGPPPAGRLDPCPGAEPLRPLLEPRLCNRSRRVPHLRHPRRNPTRHRAPHPAKRSPGTSGSPSPPPPST